MKIFDPLKESCKLGLLLSVILVLFTNQVKSQLLNNVSPPVQWGFQKQSTYFSIAPYSEDWIYGIKAVSDGGYVATGYIEEDPNGPTPGPEIASAIKVDNNGNFLWETKIIDPPNPDGGNGFDVFELPAGLVPAYPNGGYVIIGARPQTVGANIFYGFFSVLLDKITGVINPTWGVKYYNGNTLPTFPPCPIVGLNTNVGASRSHATMIKDNLNQINGFMLCGGYVDGTYPNGLGFTGNYSDGGYLIKLNVDGTIDNSFNGTGFQTYYPASPGNYPNCTFQNVCCNYDNLGNLQGYVACGWESDQPSVDPSISLLDALHHQDGIIVYMDVSGNVIWKTRYDELNYNKNTIPIPSSYKDECPDAPYCTGIGYINTNFGQDGPPLNNTPPLLQNELAVSVKQLANGGDFVVLTLNDWFFEYTLLNCPAAYPAPYPVSEGFLHTDNSVMRFSNSGTFFPMWSKNMTQSSGIDYDCDMRIDAAKNIYVLNHTSMNILTGNPLPIYNQPFISKLEPISGKIQYERTYMNPIAGEQNICTFAFDLTLDGGIVIGGNNDFDGDNNPNTLIDENYDIIKIVTDNCTTPVYTQSDITNTITISGNTTWNNEIVLGRVRIPNGATLTISSNALVQFADTKKTGITTDIFVEPGGRLFVNPGATLTSIQNCPSAMWSGIHVAGSNSSISQTATAQQGFAYLNGTQANMIEISNARTGINNVTFPTVTSGGGGYVWAFFTRFLNNNIDADIRNYIFVVSGVKINNATFFTGCEFIGDKFLNDPDYTTSIGCTTYRNTSFVHLLLSNIWDIQVIGCKFKTDVSPTALGPNYPSQLRSYGIYAVDAAFPVAAYCGVNQGTTCIGTYIPSVFENLRYGMYALSSTGAQFLSVRSSSLINCFSGIYNSGLNYSLIDLNSFEYTAPLPPIPNASPYCTYFTQCNGYHHQDNKHIVTSGQQVYGTVIDNSGTGSNLTYLNAYTNLKIGTQSQQVNGSTPNIPTGLQIKCNGHGGIINDDILQTSGVLGQQGICSTSLTTANNVFTPISGKLTSGGGSGFYYKYLLNPVGGQQTPPNIIGPVNSNICFGLNNIFNYANVCPSNFAKVGCKTCEETDVSTNAAKAAGAQQPLNDGNSPALYAAISGTMSFGNMEQLLLDKSPYLSDAVMLAYLRHPLTPPYGHIKEVIIANSPVTPEIIAELNSMNLPSGIATQINNAQTGISARKEQEDLVAYYTSQAEIATADLAHTILSSTVVSSSGNAAIITALQNSTNIYDKISLANVYIDAGNYTTASSLITQIKTYTQLFYAGQILEIYLNLKSNGKDWNELKNSTTLQFQVNSIANLNVYGSAFAKGALNIAFGTPGYEVIETTSAAKGLANESQAKKDLVSSEEENGLAINAFPNPFGGILNIGFKLALEQTDAILSITEIGSGKLFTRYEIKENHGVATFDTKNLSAGMYLITITQKNFPSKNIKVVNIK